ncbi:MAG TPA: TerB family tellurite resistance protein, partial [Candidatus Rifleibacterium sp.]|nr:TerB family tellurite resistance protein [Candidatus Rifleibacterium sp.]
FPASFAEIWSFLRKPGVKTLKKPGLIEGQCPNCGNPIKAGRLSKCDVCNSLLRSGEHDWVLAGITQACEWSTRPDPVIPGLADFAAADPGFNMQHLEDRVSVMFWRKIEAERKGDAAPLRKIARNEFCDAQIQWYKPDKGGARRFYTGCAVGAVDLLGIEISEPDDHAYVEVIWSGLPSILPAGGAIETGPQPINFRHVFILGRKHGVTTRVASSLASSHCSSCGAPEQTGAENACAYCGNVMNDGQSEWVLEAVANRQDMEVTAVLAKINQLKRQQAGAAKSAGPGNGKNTGEALSPYSIPGNELVRWATAMMLADGEIDQKELDMINNLARQRDVSAAQVLEIIGDLKSRPDPVEHMIDVSTVQVDATLLRHMARVALADGKLSNEETAMLRKIGQKLNLNASDIDLLLNRERKNLYQEAKDLIAQARRNK